MNNLQKRKPKQAINIQKDYLFCQDSRNHKLNNKISFRYSLIGKNKSLITPSDGEFEVNGEPLQTAGGSINGYNYFRD